MENTLYLFYITEPKCKVIHHTQALYTDYILWHKQFIVYALAYFDPKKYT